ncbi:MAG: DMT family transporter [Pseudomonadota bacterium]|nr:DMT family transporter [Pseudomonadota bacterium]MEC8087141.1 DMT family transporter [Pseudomonadota bacterium]MEC8463643.1 DMT family transporter [Pseudomonadota bacterium]MEC8531581.1 DMT family transporter [Pseudomonadota bacterium]MEC8726888.1 DMT family transporter [Pseudomonadota bacterium]
MDVAPKVQNARLGILLLCAGVASFGVGEACVKILAADYHILQVVWARYVFHALVFLIIFSRSGILNQMRTSRPILHIARSITLLLGTITFFTALIYLSLPDAVAINFAAPLLVTALSIPFLGEKVGPRRWVAIFIGFLGVLIIIRPGLGIMHWAALLPLATAVFYALYQILTRVAGRTEDTKTSLFWTSTVGVITMSCIVPLVWKVPNAQAWAIMIATGALFGFGHYLLIRAFEVATVSTLSPFLYTQIVWVTILSIIIFNQVPDEFSILGTVIVISSGLYIWHRETQERPTT